MPHFTPRFSTIVSVELLAAHIGDPDWLIFDLRHDLMRPQWAQEKYQEAHIPGALFVAMDEDLAAKPSGRNGRHPLPVLENFVERMRTLGLHKDKQVVIYDQAQGMFAARLWWMLRWIGFDHGAVLEGGFSRWQEKRMALESATPRVSAGDFVAKPHPEWVVTIEQVRAQAQAMFLIDARVASRYRGENETIDPVGGHIPGAHNRPYTENLLPDNTFKSAGQLHQEFTAFLGGALLDTVVHQCGSGVTACHNALAMMIAGLPAMRLYAGSWSEWCCRQQEIMKADQ